MGLSNSNTCCADHVQKCTDDKMITKKWIRQTTTENTACLEKLFFFCFKYANLKLI